MNDEERRRTRRRPVEFPVTMEEDEGAAEGTVVDISAGGCFVRAETVFPNGTLVVLSSVAPDGETFTFGARVVREVEDGEAGMGLRFTDVGPGALRGIHQHLSRGTHVRVSPAGAVEDQT